MIKSNDFERPPRFVGAVAKGILVGGLCVLLVTASTISLAHHGEDVLGEHLHIGMLNAT